MKASEFCYWLQGYFEISGECGLTEYQGEMVRNHLGLVLNHNLDAPDPTGIHDGNPPSNAESLHTFTCEFCRGHVANWQNDV